MTVTTDPASNVAVPAPISNAGNALLDDLTWGAPASSATRSDLATAQASLTLAIQRLNDVVNALEIAGEAMRQVNTHELKPNPHRQYTTPDQVATFGSAPLAVMTHELGVNPHRQYPTEEQAIMAARTFVR